MLFSPNVMRTFAIAYIRHFLLCVSNEICTNCKVNVTVSLLVGEELSVDSIRGKDEGIRESIS